jgi:hypothetical protein
MRKGDLHEKESSLLYHQKFIPFLISSKILREIDAGQIDIAYIQTIKPLRISLIEVKSQSPPSQIQRRRLRKTQDYLSRVLECETILKVKFCQKDFDSLF